MPEFKVPFPAVDLKQAITDIIESIAIEDTAYGHILNVESEILEKIKRNAKDAKELLCANASVNSIIRSVTMLKLYNSYELEDSENLLQKVVDFGESDDVEE